jgi:hypothetical protein
MLYFNSGFSYMIVIWKINPINNLKEDLDEVCSRSRSSFKIDFITDKKVRSSWSLLDNNYTKQNIVLTSAI